MKSTVTFYPVENGDCNLVEIADGPKIMIDCKFRNSAEDDENEDFDVLNDLLTNKLKKKKKGLPFLDAFILTHADQDHCLSFKDKFYLGNPSDIKEGDKNEKRILIGELWYSPRVMTEDDDDLSDDAKAFKDEAERRMKLHKKDSKDANKDGNRIRIIGWSSDAELEDIPEDCITVPGNSLNSVNGESYDNFRIFIHAPFKEHIENADRNETSIVMQIRIDTKDAKNAGKLVLGGDAEWRVWEKIIDENKKDENLKWGLFEAPHHCSYTFFADDREDDPNEKSLDFLNKKENNAFVVTSSKVVKKNSDNPPCQKSKNRYVEQVGEDNFFCTSGDSDDDDALPVVFEVEKDGFHLKTDNDDDSSSSAATDRNNPQPHVYG